MNTLYALTFFIHAGLGTLALATFWIAGLSRKSEQHGTEVSQANA